jgi:hypothetical protein
MNIKNKDKSFMELRSEMRIEIIKILNGLTFIKKIIEYLKCKLNNQ